MTSQLKVGTFVLVGLVLTTIAVFLIGDQQQFWDRKVVYETAFGDVAGLKSGAPVRLGGVDIGTVKGVGYTAGEAGDTRIHVRLSIIRREAVRIREGTVAHIVNKGLLGDKMVELEVPDPSAPALAEGGFLKGQDPKDITKYLDKLGDISTTAQKTLDNMEAATRPLADPKFSKDIKESVASLNEILGAVAHNDSAAHRLLMDPREGERVDRILVELDSAMGQLAGAMGDVHDATEHVRNGPGLVHAVVYDGEVSQNAAGALAEVHKDLQAVREGNGLAHALIYGDDKTQHVMGNVDAMSEDLRQIVANIRAGKGTLGALLVDPSVYEDIKAAIGNVERNQVLRSLVRYSIKADEQHPHPEPPR